MWIKRVLGAAILGGFLATLVMGCSGGTEVKLAPAPPEQAAPPKELPKDRKGGGSGLMKKNPGGNT